MSDYQKYPHGDTSWFQRDRFGMFIHWGLYSMPARHEWIRNREGILDEDYQVYFDLFDPDMFNPKEWAASAKKAGMKYFVITAKHHEGFCLWDSKYTDYKATNTPAGRDLLREVIDAFRAEGLKVGIYYSLIDWHHEDFTLDPLHPMVKHGGLSEDDICEINSKRDMAKYRQYMYDQITELLTGYGKIDILWFDFSYPQIENGKGRDDWGSEKIIEIIRRLQPWVIIDNRLDLPGASDIVTPEQYTPRRGMTDDEGNPVVWEGCQTFSGSWGYYRDEMSWKTPELCIQMLINHVSRGGNMLMNVGPTSRGYFDARAQLRLEEFGRWMKYHSRSIYNCTCAPEEFEAPQDCRYTYNPETNRLYLHIFTWQHKKVVLPGVGDKVRYIQLLNDGSECTFMLKDGSAGTHMFEKGNPGDIEVLLPDLKPDVAVPVLEIILRKEGEKSSGKKENNQFV